MASLSNTNLESLFTMLKGEPGLRKSTVALSYPRPQYWYSFDKKMEALALPASKWNIPLSDIEYDDYTDWDKPKAHMKSLQVKCKYKTLIVDSLTSGGDSMTDQVRKSKTSGGKTIGGIQVSGFEEFNAESAAFQEMIAMLKDIKGYHKVNIVLIAHVVGVRKSDENNKSTHHSRIIVTGAEKISAKIASYMGEVYHFNIEPNIQADVEGNYTLFTSHTGNDYARTSLPLERKITFNDKPFYPTYVVPAIEKLKQSIQSNQATQPTIVKPTFTK